ncbi:MAG: RtcB family protein [Bdellovibrio sp.]
MDLSLFEKVDDYSWMLKQHDDMRVNGYIYASEKLIVEMDHKVYEQVKNVATLPGIVEGSYAMPDAHWGYGFPIGGVAAFDPEQKGIVSAGGVGFDISCGVRLLRTGLHVDQIQKVKASLAEILFADIPAGVGSQSALRLNEEQMTQMLKGGARWAVQNGYGKKEDLEYIEEKGCMSGAHPEEVSFQAKKRQSPEMGTLGSGNHYFEVQEVVEVFDQKAAEAFGLEPQQVVICIHCGSRGLGHQIGTEFLRSMAIEAEKNGIRIPDRELACAPIDSQTGISYIGAMRAAMNCAMANRQILTHFARKSFGKLFPKAELSLMYDVSHNTCKEEQHFVNGEMKNLFVHRKGATRAFGPGHEELPLKYRDIGQPVIIGGSMGVGSYVLVGTSESEKKSFSSSCHGAGRAMSRHEASRIWKGSALIKDLEQKGILIRSLSYKGVAEEAPDAYKNVKEVVDAAEHAKLSTKVAYLRPLICVKG